MYNIILQSTTSKRIREIVQILPREDIPRQLWNNDVICMPDCLVVSYDATLEEYNVKQLALDLQGPARIIGGPTLEATLEHFARRYGVSSCRIESLVIDPHSAFFSVSDDLVSIFSEGKIALLDIACGSGSVGASLLSTFYVLRREHKLPITPTTIQIIGGDCSPYALDIYEKMMERLLTKLETTGIHSNLQTVKWQAEASYATSELFDLLFDKNPDADEYIVFIANFSGAMDPHFEEYKGSIQHIFDRTHNRRCAIVWVEPGGYSRAMSLFAKIRKIVEMTPWARANQTGPIYHDYQWLHPLQNRHLPCKVLLKAYNRRY